MASHKHHLTPLATQPRLYLATRTAVYRQRCKSTRHYAVLADSRQSLAAAGVSDDQYMQFSTEVNGKYQADDDALSRNWSRKTGTQRLFLPVASGTNFLASNIYYE